MPGEPTTEESGRGWDTPTEESGRGWDTLEARAVSPRAGLPEPSNCLEGDTECDGVGTALYNRGCWPGP